MKMEIRDHTEVQILAANCQDWNGETMFVNVEGRIVVVANFDDDAEMEDRPMVFYWIPGQSTEDDGVRAACSWFGVTEDECNFPDFL